ncbi:DUF3515 family protein [Agromyces humatus]|uniref:DUF3515 domain-containing protein n=1 Tax=Agromyces humatus TaxID=279573 RepID=A0ABN2KF91_9MICO|nr:DUF3515 family protein [Agromyces humatus]
MEPAVTPARRRRLTTALIALGIVLATAGCSPVVPMDAAADAESADCAAVSVRLPDMLASGSSAEQAERETNAQGTGAWGSPASVLLRCGVTPPGPTTDRCVSVDGVDWVIDESDAPRFRFTTYGRTPAVEVLVDNEVVSGTTVIAELSPAVSIIPATGECTTTGASIEDAIG